MTDTTIFIIGAIVSILVVLGAFVYTVIEFRQMAQHPERYPDRDEDLSDKMHLGS